MDIDTVKCNNPVAPYNLVKTMRASFYVLGPLLSRFKEATVSLPGGCAWGPRPVDFHLKALSTMGGKVTLDYGNIIIRGDLKGRNVKFEKISVGATGNILTVKLMHEMERTGARYGLVSMCIGGGQGIATIFERLG